MTVAGVAASKTKKIVKYTLAILFPRFNSSKCKTAAKMAVARIKLLRNKREVVVRQMRRDLALLLQSGQDATARVRVEHVIREQNVLAANEFIELFCELVVSRLTIISKQKECPADLKEGIASLIFAAPRCSEIPELQAIRDIFEKKYGRDFVAAATDLRPNCGVNRMLIEKLSVRNPSGEVKLKLMKEIAKEHQIQWDTEESEKELLKAPEEPIDGPRSFISASSVPVKPAQTKPSRLTSEGEVGNMHFQDTASAAEAAAEAAKQAIAAANAAAHLANKGFNQVAQAPNSVLDSNASGNEQTKPVLMDGQHVYRRHSYNETRPVPKDSYRRYSYNETGAVQNQSAFDSYNSSPHSDVKFDESDYDEEIEMEKTPAGVFPPLPPPERPPPAAPSSHVYRNLAPRTHPKLPDYDALAARFEALKHQKSQT